jgi:hypothetical protein
VEESPSWLRSSAAEKTATIRSALGNLLHGRTPLAALPA